MRTFNQMVRSASVEQTSWKKRLPTFLRIYRGTPHASTKISPFEVLTGRQMNFGLQCPTLPTKAQSSMHSRVSQNDERAKQRMCIHADRLRHTKQSSLQPGDQVLIKQKKLTKLTPPFSPRPYEVTEKKGSMVTARRGNHQVVRNSSHFKAVKGVPSTLRADADGSPEEEWFPEPGLHHSPSSPALQPRSPFPQEPRHPPQHPHGSPTPGSCPEMSPGHVTSPPAQRSSPGRVTSPPTQRSSPGHRLTPSPPVQKTPPSRPTRERRPPIRLNDYVT